MEVRHHIKSILIKEIFDFNNSNNKYTPPKRVSDNCKKTLDHIQKNNISLYGGNDGSGLEKSKEFYNKTPQSHSSLKRLKHYFDKKADLVKKEKEKGNDISNSKELLQWELRGGDDAYDWVSKEIGSTKEKNLRTKRNIRQGGGERKNKGMGIFDINFTDPTNTRNKGKPSG